MKKLEILGFKSFADRIKVEFSHGITGIVGPNGCGKSNIADAFRWVLGEQSAKSMRGSKMPDVIFAGTTSRKPLNFAEVTITLADINGALPIEYEEIAVTRRLHRSGESEYFLNRQSVRLKDLQSLFLDTGIGKNAFSIFEQGKIDQVINLAPLERRYIFEEAAGILRFLQRKKEALRKLEQADLNICRVQDIHKEEQKQIVVLEEQAEKARIYKEKKSRLEALDKAAFLAKWELLMKRIADAGRKEGEQKQAFEDLQKEQEVLQEQLHTAKVSLQEGEKALRARNEDLFKARSEKEIKSRERLASQERIKEAVAKEKKWRAELEAMIQKRLSRKSEHQQNISLQVTLEREHNEQEKLLKEKKETSKNLEQELNKLREQQSLSQQHLMRVLASESTLDSELKQNRLRLETNQEKMEGLEEKHKRLTAASAEFSASHQEKQKQVQELSESIDNQKLRFSALEEKLQEIGEQIQATQTELDLLQQDIHEAKARQKVLLRMRSEMEGFTAGSKRLLQEAADPKSPLHGKVKAVYEFLVPQEGAEKAIAAVMRPYAQTLVVKTRADFQEAMQFSHKNQVKDFSLLCLELFSSKKDSDAAPLIPEGIEPLLSKVLDNAVSAHFLSNAYAALDLETALHYVSQSSGVEMWTQDGVFVDKRNVLFYTVQSENNVFLREAELKALEKKLQEKETGKLEKERLLKDWQQKRSHIQTERIEMDKVIRRSEMTLVEANFMLQRVVADLEKAKNEAKLLDAEMKNIKLSLEKISTTLAELSLRYTEAKENAAQARKQSESLHADLEQKAKGAKMAHEEWQAQEMTYQKLATEVRKVQHALHVLEVKDLEGEQQETRLSEEIESARELQTFLQMQTEEQNRVLEAAEKSLEKAAAAYAAFEEEVGLRREAIERIDLQLQDFRARQKRQEADSHQLSLQITQIDSVRHSLEEELQERYRLTMAAVRSLELQIDKSIDHTEKQIRLLRQELEAAGDINMTSIEELEKHKVRYEFLNKQIDDFSQSRQELIEIIAQLDSESRKIFKETFEQICSNFKKNFRILFEGGDADLQFTDTADVLEAGIDIIAKPPGKQMRSINLMSGGEKCLTAMALLFAIFEVKPAPFCILDEIDAPLDDSNVERFVNVVKQFIDRCQFIIITHNKRTMAIADVLFGVSMEEKGVSKLLSMEFAKQTVPEPV